MDISKIKNGNSRIQYRFGANFEQGRGTEFHLWAPRHNSVEIILSSPQGEQQYGELESLADGFFALTVPEAAPGWRYSYRVDGAGPFPDPASRFQPADVHAASEVVDPSYEWSDDDWAGSDWQDAVLYELHVGAFTPEGTFSGVASRLDHLADLGVTALELMPVADFPGTRNWGYDGTFLFAPDATYGRPEDLKDLVNACHARGIAVILDVVYNHFGPDGNYLWPICRPFFNPRRMTPWGEGIDIGHPVVSAYFQANARFWLEEYHFDGFRFDAIHALEPLHRDDFLADVRRTARAAAPHRNIFLVLENVDNQADLLRDTGGGAYDAQWNDNFHTALHALLTGERGGHYGDHAVPEASLERSMREGFVFQGQYSEWHGRSLGSSTEGLPMHAFVYFLQTHDMCGNRAFGERLHHLIHPDAYNAAVALYLFLPGVPMLFMGEEFLASTPFLFFCDHAQRLAESIREGRIQEHVAYADWGDPEKQAEIPDPQAEATFLASCLDWNDLNRNPDTVKLYRRLLKLRSHFMPRMRRDRNAVEIVREGKCYVLVLNGRDERESLACVANLDREPQPSPSGLDWDKWEVLYSTEAWRDGLVPGYAAAWLHRRA